MRRSAVLLAVAMLLPAGTARASFTQEPGSPYDVGNDPYGVLAGDFTGDGRPDVVSLNGSASTVSVLVRGALGGFTLPATVKNVATGPNYGATGDFDGDGKLDLVVAAYTQSGGSSVLLGNGAGDFTVVPVASTWGTSAAAADFTGDGRADIAITQDAVGPGTVKILRRNAGNTGFEAEPLAPPTGALPRHAIAAELDGVTLPDLAVTNWTSGTVTVLLRRAGGFVEAEGSPHAVGAKPDGIAAGDFDGDGRTDLAVVSFEQDLVTVLIGQGGGKFAKEADYPVGDMPLNVAVADFNADGRHDMAVTNSGADSVSILLRSGATFVPDGPPVASADGAYGLATADFNADSLPDLAVTNSATADSVTILLNTTPPPPPPPPDNLDADGDKVQRPADCDDTNATIFPGAVDIPGDGIDQDCLDGDASYPRLRRLVAYDVKYGTAYSVFTSLSVKPARAGDRIRVRCKGRRCKVAKKVVLVGKDAARLPLTRHVRGARMRPGDSLEVRITRPATIGKSVKYTVRSGRKPRKRERCLPPGATTPVKCA